MIDSRRLRPGELCRLLNSSPLGEVTNERQLRRQRLQAGLRIGDGRHVDLLRYVAWLVQVRHTPKAASAEAAPAAACLEEAAQGAAALGSRRQHRHGHGQKLSRKQESLIAALLTEPSYAAAASKAGVGQATLYRWMHLPVFRDAYRQARRELVESAIGRIQAGNGLAFETLLAVAHEGRRDSDRVRAAIALLNFGLRGANDAGVQHGERQSVETTPMDSGEVVQLLSIRLRQLDAAELPAGEKARLMAALSDVLLRAIQSHAKERGYSQEHETQQRTKAEQHHNDEGTTTRSLEEELRPYADVLQRVFESLEEQAIPSVGAAKLVDPTQADT